MDRSRFVFVAVMSLAGLALAGLEQAWPALSASPAPPLVWLLALVFVLDAGLAAFGRRFGMAPPTAALRFSGALSGALMFLLARIAFDALKAPLA